LQRYDEKLLSAIPKSNGLCKIPTFREL